MPVRTPPPPNVLRPVVPADERPAPADAPLVAFSPVPYSAPPIGSQATGNAEASVAAGDILERGDSGSAVADLQRRLHRLGYPISADGGFGPYTESKVKAFQADHEVSTTGKVGPTTLLALRVAEARRPDIAISALFPSVGPGRHLAMGARGMEVETLQRLLSLAGHRVQADGAFGASTRTALQDFQRANQIAPTGELGPTTLAALDRRVDALGVRLEAMLGLPSGYGSLERLAGELVALDSRFSPQTAEGRSTLGMALAIGGTEVYGRHTTGTDFFTRRGGTGNRMLGFAQFNLDYHAHETATPQRYARYLADILHGLERMPNSAPAANHARALRDAVARGSVSNGTQLLDFLHARGFGGSNWQGIDDGWHRAPGLADALVRFVRAGTGGVNS